MPHLLEKDHLVIKNSLFIQISFDANLQSDKGLFVNTSLLSVLGNSFKFGIWNC